MGRTLDPLLYVTRVKLHYFFWRERGQFAEGYKIKKEDKKVHEIFLGNRVFLETNKSTVKNMQAISLRV